MLAELRHVLMAVDGPVSLRQLAMHFDRDESVIEGMLSHWQRKGLVVSEDSICPQTCGGCQSGQQGDRYYRWLSVEQRSPLIATLSR